MSDILQPGEAWILFDEWVSQPENWSRVDRRGRDRIGKARRAFALGLPRPLGEEGIASLLRDYGAEVFEVEVKWVFRRKGI